MDPTLQDVVTVDGTGSIADTGGSSWFEAIGGWLGSTTADLTKIGGQYLLNQQRLQAQQAGLKMTSLGQGGYYFDGQTGTYRALPGTVGGMSGGTLLMIGAALVAVMLLKD